MLQLIDRMVFRVVLVVLLFVMPSSLRAEPVILDSPEGEAGGWFGRAVVAADLNADGHADIVVGAPAEPVGDNANQGQVHVFDGQTFDLMHTLVTPNAVECGAPDQRCRFGEAIAIGDVDADELPEIIVGAHSEMQDGYPKGRVYVFNGSGGDFMFALSAPSEPFCGFGFGNAVASGDVNNDGREDIVVDCDEEVLVFDASSQELLYRLESPMDNGEFGTSLAVVDVNQDDRVDVVVGSPAVGKVYVFDGNAGELMLTLDLPTAATCDRGHIDAFTARCGFGHSVAAGVDVAGTVILMVGAYAEDLDVPDQGRVYVFDSEANLLGSLTTPNPNVSACIEERECNRFGIAVTSGHVNDDGLADIIVGANAEPLDGTANLQGRVYVYTSRLCGALRCFDHAVTNDSPSPVELPEVLFGSSVAADDVDGDEKDDIIVGAFRDDVGGRQEQGRVYLFLSGPSPANYPVFLAWLEDVLWFRGWPFYQALRDTLPMPWPPLIYAFGMLVALTFIGLALFRTFRSWAKRTY